MSSEALAATAVAVAVALALALASDEDAGICPHDPATCFFSDNYHEARARFREAALHANATLHRLEVSTPPHMDLTIDVAVLQDADAAIDVPTLVHMSGAHGVETYPGSAVQLALLSKAVGREGTSCWRAHRSRACAQSVRLSLQPPLQRR